MLQVALGRSKEDAFRDGLEQACPTFLCIFLLSSGTKRISVLSHPRAYATVSYFGSTLLRCSSCEKARPNSSLLSFLYRGPFRSVWRPALPLSPTPRCRSTQLAARLGGDAGLLFTNTPREELETSLAGTPGETAGDRPILRIPQEPVLAAVELRGRIPHRRMARPSTAPALFITSVTFLLLYILRRPLTMYRFAPSPPCAPSPALRILLLSAPLPVSSCTSFHRFRSTPRSGASYHVSQNLHQYHVLFAPTFVPVLTGAVGTVCRTRGAALCAGWRRGNRDRHA